MKKEDLKHITFEQLDGICKIMEVYEATKKSLIDLPLWADDDVFAVRGALESANKSLQNVMGKFISPFMYPEYDEDYVAPELEPEVVEEST